MTAGAQHAPQRLQRLFGAEACGMFGHHFGKADDRIERSAQFMAHIGEELRLVLTRDLELAALLLDLAEQARVLNRDHRLRGEGLQQIDRALGEFPGLAAPHHEGAHHAIRAQQRHHQQPAIAFPQHDVGELRRGFVLEVRHLHRLATFGRPADRGILQLEPMFTERGGKSLAHPVGGAQSKLATLLIVDVDGAGIRVGELNGLGDDRGEHGFQLERRIDGLADLAQGRELTGAELHPVFEVGVGFLQPARHVVELIGKRFQLVAGLDRDALGEIAAADAGGAGAQRLDRDDHSARQEQPGDESQGERPQ